MSSFFFFNDTATTEIYTLSLHDALPISSGSYDYVAETAFSTLDVDGFFLEFDDERSGGFEPLRYIPKGKRVVLGLVSSKIPDRKSTRLNSSHLVISYAVFCLKQKIDRRR